VETGETMRAAGLEIIADVMISETVLIQNKFTTHPDLCRYVVTRLQGVVHAKRLFMVFFNLPKSALDDVRSISPGMRAPTVTQLLADADWVAVSCAVERSDAHEIMDRLIHVGAKDILMFDVRNCRV